MRSLMLLMLLADNCFASIVGEETGLKTTLHKVRLPGPPRAFRIVVLNTAAPNGLTLNPAFTKLVAGNWTNAPSLTTPSLASGKENHGISIAPDVQQSVNCSFMYGDQAGVNATGAYAVIQGFALTPAMPEFVGVQVNSNLYKADISIAVSIYGDGPTTEFVYIITVAPPKQAQPPAAPLNN